MNIRAGRRPDPASLPVAGWKTILITAVACTVLLGHILTFSFVLSDGRHLFLSDDALISLRYADRLIQGRGLTWNDDEPPVEGYSNLLWVLAVSALGMLGVNLILSARILGCLGPPPSSRPSCTSIHCAGFLTAGARRSCMRSCRR